MCRSFLSVLFALVVHLGFSQFKPIQYLKNVFNDTALTERPKWIGYPTIAYAPETSWEIGGASAVLYYAKKDTNNRLSEASGFTFFTLEGQYGLHLEHAIYSDKNNWFSLGKMKFQSYPLAYYGVGPSISGEELAIANANFIIVRERLLRKIKGHWYAGVEVNLESLSKVRFDWEEGVTPETNILGIDGYSNFGVGLGLVYDSRHNVLNVREGFLSEIAFLGYNQGLGSTNNLNTVFLDNRAFFKTSKRNVLALQMIGQFSTGEVPFNQLSMIGGEMMMRGYYLGKFRDRNMCAFQAEHRWLPFSFSKRIGGALFAGVGSVSENLNFNKLLWTAGGGVRFLLFPKRDVYTRIDVGVNPYGYGVYFFIGEAF